MFELIADEAIRAYDKIIGLDLSEVAVDGSLHKSPAGGEGTGKNPTDRAKLGWKWSVLTDANGIPIGWAIDGANRHDSVMLEPTLEHAARRGLLCDIETIWLDRGYDSEATRLRLRDLGIDDAVIAKKRKRGIPSTAKKLPMGLRWPVERTNSWLSKYRALRRDTDRKIKHRLAQFALAVAFLLTAKLIIGATAGHQEQCLSAEPLNAMSSGDAFISIMGSESFANSHKNLFPARPEGGFDGSSGVNLSRTDFPQCLSHPLNGNGQWIAFSQAGRNFYVLAAIGTSASAALRSDVYRILNWIQVA